MTSWENPRSEEGRGTAAIPSPLSSFTDQWGSPRLPQAGWLPGWYFFLGSWNGKKRGCLGKRSPNLTAPIHRVYKTLSGVVTSLPNMSSSSFQEESGWGQHPGVRPPDPRGCSGEW